MLNDEVPMFNAYNKLLNILLLGLCTGFLHGGNYEKN